MDVLGIMVQHGFANLIELSCTAILSARDVLHVLLWMDETCTTWDG